jgi:D-sedoheptulose 7-phosphate isomerase
VLPKAHPLGNHNYSRFTISDLRVTISIPNPNHNGQPWYGEDISSGIVSLNVTSNSPRSETLTTAALLARSLKEHLESLQALLDTKLHEIQQAGETICQALSDGGKVLLCGNGGSAADAQHIAAELVGRYEQQRRAYPALALTTDSSALTALSNDYGYENVFARQVQALATKGDVLIAISTSGKSANILQAVKTARSMGCKTIALTGSSGDSLAAICDLAVVVPAQRTSRVQEAHITVGHLWCEMVDANLGKQVQNQKSMV